MSQDLISYLLMWCTEADLVARLLNRPEGYLMRAHRLIEKMAQLLHMGTRVTFLGEDWSSAMYSTLSMRFTGTLTRLLLRRFLSSSSTVLDCRVLNGLGSISK